MSRPVVYKRISDNYNGKDRYLASISCLYGLVYEGEWLIQVKPTQYKDETVRKYYRHIYSTRGQAESVAKRIEREYFVRPEIVEINTNDLQLD